MIFVFDVDDTLYDLAEPFKKALRKNFPEIEVDIEQVFLKYRAYSDEVFEKTVSGQMSMREMYIYRISKALEDYGYLITTQEALIFQRDYAEYQKLIELEPDMRKIFNYLKMCNLTMGIITNGPHKHQEKKIDILNVRKWIAKKNVMISGEFGHSKPDPQIFNSLEEKLDASNDDVYYIGDSFHSDVEGAWNAGWIPIWLNTRGKIMPYTPNNEMYEVKSYKELLNLIMYIVGE